MAKKLDQKQIVDFKELLMSEVVQSEALINLLDKKGLVSKQELLKEMERVQASMIKSQCFGLICGKRECIMSHPF